MQGKNMPLEKKCMEFLGLLNEEKKKGNEGKKNYRGQTGLEDSFHTRYYYICLF